MSRQTLSIEYLAIDPEIRFGKPHIIGTRITVEDIAVMHLEMKQSLEEIKREYNLSLASIYAAMAYYYDHQAEIAQRRREGKEFAENLKRHHPSKLEDKLEQIKSE